MPGYLPPFEDELFTSWYLRLSINHRIKNYNFTQFYFGSHSIWNRDFDLNPNESLITNLVQQTPLNKCEIEQLFLRSYVGSYVPSLNFDSVNRYILPLGIYHRLRRKNGQLFCPSCLNNEIPFYKKTWRLVYSLICRECKVELFDKCGKCSSPIMFYRLDIGRYDSIKELNLNRCWNCGYNLIYDTIQPSSAELINFQFEMLDLKGKDNKVFLNRIEFYIVLLSIICYHGTNKVKMSFFQEFGIDQSIKFDFSQIASRKILLPKIHLLLTSYRSIVDFLFRYSLTYSYFDRYSSGAGNFQVKLASCFLDLH
jgi:DNA-directed RNA polymerase subunit RPC12/RpoP